MPRKFLKRYSPTAKTIRENRALSVFGESIHHSSLWCMNRHSVAKAFAIGLFCAWLPMPLQTVLAAALAVYFRANLPLSVVLVFVTNPITIPPMFYFAYKLGSFLLDLEPQSVPMDLSWTWFTTTLQQIWQPLLFGSIILGIFSSMVGYLAIQLIWRKSVRRRWVDRAEGRKARKAKRAMEKEIKKAVKEELKLQAEMEKKIKKSTSS